MAGEPTPFPKPEVKCCEMRIKVPLVLAPSLPEEVCGINDSVMADFVRYDLAGPKKECDGLRMPVLSFRFCPWCGKPWVPTGEVRTVHFVIGEPDNTGEEWKKDAEPESDERTP
jgi:hypothetical protein